MPSRLPPRREPRVLALVRSETGFHYATADPWELRSVASVTCHDLSLGPAIARAIRREKPTLVVPDRLLHAAALRAARRSGIPLAEGALPTLPLTIARDLYPELSMRAPDPAQEIVARRAIAAVLYAQTPVRPYAAHRRRPLERTA